MATTSGKLPVAQTQMPVSAKTTFGLMYQHISNLAYRHTLRLVQTAKIML